MWLTPGSEAAASYQFELPEATPSLNELRAIHWQDYRKLRRHYRAMVSGLLLVQRVRIGAPIRHAMLLVERGAASGGLDWDNAYGGLKPLMDCLVAPTTRNPDGLGLIQDDGPCHIPVPPIVRQTKTPRGQGYTRVAVFDLERPQVRAAAQDLSFAALIDSFKPAA